MEKTGRLEPNPFTVNIEEQRRFQEALSKETLGVVFFVARTGVYPTPAQMAYIMGDDAKWQEALADSSANLGAATQ